MRCLDCLRLAGEFVAPPPLRSRLPFLTFFFFFYSCHRDTERVVEVRTVGLTFRFQKPCLQLNRKLRRETPCWRVLFTAAVVVAGLFFFISCCHPADLFDKVNRIWAKETIQTYFFPLSAPPRLPKQWPLRGTCRFLKAVGHSVVRPPLRVCQSAVALFAYNRASISATDCCSHAQGSRRKDI